jgi:tRNA dimethylallyltransferase
MKSPQKPKPKLVVVLGPTSSGKSDLAVLIAKKFNGEVVSADSRQVYRGMDIGTGKVTKKEMAGIPHHLLDVADPKRKYSVAHFKRDAEKAIANIQKRGKLPILCGGTGFYIQAVVDGLILPEVKPNPKLRKELEKLSTKELFARLKKMDSRRAKEIDRDNPHRLIRAIEIATELGKVPELKTTPESTYDTLQIGIETNDIVLQTRIHNRLLKRMKRGMLAEVKRLHDEGVSWRRLEGLGLEYKHLALYLQGKLKKDEMLELLELAIVHYAKRQKTWNKKDPRTKWVSFEDTAKTYGLVKDFLGT